MRVEKPGSGLSDTGGVKATSLERLKAARERLSRLMEELTDFQRELDGIADELVSLPGAGGEEEPPPQSVKRSDAPVVQAPEEGAGSD
jgi:hypothetical protein